MSRKPTNLKRAPAAKSDLVHPLSPAFARQKYLDRYIVHLRQRCNQRNLNLVLGAGSTRDAGTPLWDELIKGLRSKVNAISSHQQDVPWNKFGPAMAAEVLLKWFDAQIKNDKHYRRFRVPAEKRASYVNNKWHEAIKEVIYDRVPTTTDACCAQHPYLEALAALVIKCPLTINFNFDDIIDRAAQAVCEKMRVELPNSVFKLPIGGHSSRSTILHINGYLPQTGRTANHRLVLTEAAFAELMLQQTNYQSIALLRGFAETTMMIVGCSLEDSSLKAILRSSSQINPANFHYIIHFIDDEKAWRPHLQKIFDANKDVYNLITVFLKKEEYKPFLELISTTTPSEFEVTLKELEPQARSKYLFYIVGAVGAGKTTLIRNLRLFKTYEEWFAPVPSAMYRDTTTLNKAEKREVDVWLKSQLRQKNLTMRRADTGFHVMDRGYLDMISFSANHDENAEKLQMLETYVAGDDGLQDGVGIVLCCDPERLEESQWERGRTPVRFGGDGFTKETLSQQQDLLKKIYKPHRLIDARSATPSELARTTAFDILTGEYKTVSFSGQIRKIKNGSLKGDYSVKPLKGRHSINKRRRRNRNG